MLNEHGNTSLVGPENAPVFDHAWTVSPPGFTKRPWHRLLPSLPLALILMIVLGFGCGLAKGVLWGIPPPVAQDESGYLLSSDTFASGRITNPTHPMWRHFESMFVIQKPTYVGKYPPGQALFLALGQKLTGEPIVGVWLSTALASAALCWMLWQWLSPPWALLGSLIGLSHLVVNYWNYTYWGGSVALLGGALVFGALRRLPDRFRLKDGVLLALGIALFANTRPFEGLVTCLAAAALLAFWSLRGRLPITRAAAFRLFAPLLIILGCTGIWLGYYNWRTTGQALTFAQDVHTKTYYPVPYLILQHPRPAPAFAHSYMQVQYERDIRDFRKERTPSGFLTALWTKFVALWGFYVGLGLVLPLLALPLLFRDPWMRFALFVCSCALAILFLETWVFPHYAAPFASLLFLIVTECTVMASAWRWGRLPIGKWLLGFVVVFHLALLVFAVAHHPTYIQRSQPWALTRQRLIQRLSHDGHQHLMIVKYAADHVPDHEWVYNLSDLDHTPVVWAHQLSSQDQNQLLNYYSDRYVWLVEADCQPPRVTALRSPLSDHLN